MAASAPKAGTGIRPVVCIGAVYLDTLAHAMVPVAPDTSTPARFEVRLGGVAANVARALSRLAVPARLIGVCGDDQAAVEIRATLDREGVPHCLNVRIGMATGRYIAFHGPDGRLAAACVDDHILSTAPAGLFDADLNDAIRNVGKDGLWFADANCPPDMLARIAAHAPAGGLVFNGVSAAKAVRLTGVFNRATLVFLNRVEAAALSGGRSSATAEDLATALATGGRTTVVVTDGADGLCLSASGQTVRLAGKPAPVKDVTGAGDALIAGTLAALARSMPLRDALDIGQAAARLTVQSAGAVAPDLTWEKLWPAQGPSAS
ncbi:MAG: bifunctional hydroxymethylpyrimidine kinase/phosphomethylpyrimidine kinase [Roseibium sp.]|nr:bifunctional hydroxymethylpyrimidine kinase/phosphomethylpyrimidine kinase [Roseibium sp.]